MALEVADALDLDEVVWIPAGDPPHKRRRQLTPAHLRLRMVRAATMGEPRFRVSEIEVNREGPSYTIDTLRALRSEEPSADLYLILGIDQYRAFESWRAPEEILTMASLTVMDRGGESLPQGGDVADRARRPDTPHAPAGTVISVPVERVDVSSTRVRAAVDRGESIVDLVPRGVARIIEAEGLYRRVDG